MAVEKPQNEDVNRQIVTENTFILDPEGYGKVEAFTKALLHRSLSSFARQDYHSGH